MLLLLLLIERSPKELFDLRAEGPKSPISSHLDSRVTRSGQKNEFVQVVLQVKVETDERNKTCSMHAFSNFLGFVGNEAEGIKEDSKIVKPLLIFFRSRPEHLISSFVLFFPVVAFVISCNVHYRNYDWLILVCSFWSLEKCQLTFHAWSS